MKYYIVLLSTSLCMLLFLGFNTTKNISKNKNHNNRFPPLSTLDSLQGKWINEDDSLNVVIINGRYWNEQYNDNVQPINKFYRIYFSDTAVQTNNFLNASFDTTALSGNYIVTVKESDNSMECWQMNGVYINNSDTTFSINPAVNWTMKSVLVFRKTQ